MKNFLACVVAMWCLVTSVASAEVEPYLHGDKNFPLVWENSQAAWYLDKNSVTVKVNDPPFFIVSAKVVTAGGAETCEVFFDEDDVDMRIFDNSTKDWLHLNPSEVTAENQQAMCIGEAIFYVTQGRKFYGNYLWKSDKEYLDVFSDEFYENLR